MGMPLVGSQLGDDQLKTPLVSGGDFYSRMPMIVDAFDEDSFQQGIRSTDWWREFVKEYGEEPDLDSKDYDYRAAWAAGIRPERSQTDGGKYHWASSLPDGTMLKSKDHKTAWKEYYMRQYGVDPDVAGVSEDLWKALSGLDLLKDTTSEPDVFGGMMR